MSVNKADAIKKAQRNDSDTGSTAVQISIISERIKNLSEHLKTNRKDKHSTKGLTNMISKRRKLVKYLKKTNPQEYSELAEKIGLKK